MSKNLHEKMLAVMQAVEYLSKDDNVAYGNTRYRAMSEEKVTSVIRAELVKQGIIVFPIEQTVTREGTLTTTNTKYKMVNVEDPQDYEILASSGQGADTQDKGVGKAMTYSFKYLFLRTFAIPTGEDPDKIPSAELDDEQLSEPDKRKKINRLIKQTNTDPVLFLTAMGRKFKRTVESVDDMAGKELDYALKRINEKVSAKEAN